MLVHIITPRASAFPLFKLLPDEIEHASLDDVVNDRLRRVIDSAQFPELRIISV